MHCKEDSNTENSKQIFPEKELRGYSPNSNIHVSVSDLYITLIGLPILGRRIGGPNVGIAHRHINEEIEKLEILLRKIVQ
jgi:hypothetical protein